MASNPTNGDRGSRRQSIPLRDLLASSDGHGSSGHDERRHLGVPGASGTTPQMSHNMSFAAPGWDAPYHTTHEDDDVAPSSPIDPTALQSAIPFGFESSDLLHVSSPGVEEPPNFDYFDSDQSPLTAGAQPISGSAANQHTDALPRNSFQTVSDIANSPTRGRSPNSLGHDLHYDSSRPQTYGATLDPTQYRISRSSSPSGALSRAGSMVRAMSQRVVNISGESEAIDRRNSHQHSRSPHQSIRESAGNATSSMFIDTSYRSQTQTQSLPAEKNSFHFSSSHEPPLAGPRQTIPNPLRGRSLGIFSPDNAIRLWLCGFLVNPYTEPAILMLIVAQTVLLAVESGPDVFSKGNGRPDRWAGRPIDWAMLGLFIIFTLELFARIIVSGFVLNAAEYSTIDRQRGVRAAITDQYRAVFQPQRHRSVRGSRQTPVQPSAISRSFTTIMQGPQTLPSTVEDQQRFQLARRAFLRHSFNRFDFVAVVSFWVAFVLEITGLESQHHLYVFKMLSCLRIIRLLALTHGTAIILRSLKKATPLLVRVAFLVCFFWLLFAIIGIQSFKASLKRQCVWLDPLDPNNLDASFTNEFEFCGGHLDNKTGATLPWVRFTKPQSLENLKNGTDDGKGFLCPRGSICLEQNNPYNGTVNFDNIFHSLELVFVIMSANTFSDIMYYTMGSDYSTSALFFGAGIMIMMLWLTNLLIAVITSSFQVIREESKSSAFTVGQEPLTQPRPDKNSWRISRLQKVYNKTFGFWILVIGFALLCQSLRSASMSPFRENFINNAEIFATILLDFEIIFRFVANWRRFHVSWRNLFDATVAIITSVILIPPIHHSRAYAWLSVFQIVRIYRVVLAIPVTRNLIMLVLGNAAGIGNLMLFVYLMTFLVAIFAAQLFRGEIPVYEDGELNRISFNTIFNSFLGMYQILSSENWTDILYSVTSYTTSLKTAWIGTIFLIGWFILSFFILVNMFIAVIQENFDVSEDEKRLEQVKAFLQSKELGHAQSNLALSTIFSLGRSRPRKDPLDYGPRIMEMLLNQAIVKEFLDDGSNGAPGEGGDDAQGPRRAATAAVGDVKPGRLSKIWTAIGESLRSKEHNPFYSNIRFSGPNDTLDPRQMAQEAVDATAARRKAQREYLARHPKYNNSLYLFKPKNPLRRWCQKLVGPARGLERFDGVEPNKIAWYSFSALVYAVVVAMVVIACVVTPLYQKEYRKTHAFSAFNWYVWTDVAFTAVFTFEAVVKIIADGLIWTPNAYLRSSWGIMDTVVLVTLWINVVTLFINDGSISRAVGAFKALRALRLLNVSDSARDTFHSLIIVGWWKVFGAAFVSISLLIPFALYGLNLFNGLMVSCNDSDDIISLNSCFGEFNSTPYHDDWALLAPRAASNPYFSFDDFGSSLFTLFQIVSQEGWTDVSFAAQAITSRGLQPQDLANQGNAVFFVVFNLSATVFVLTLFISVFMRNYTEQTGMAFLTTEQRSWLELRKLLRHISPSKSSYDESEKSWKKWCHKRAIEKRGKWYQSITIVLVLHLVLLLIEFTDEPDWWTLARIYLFLAFILVYLANIAIRIAGLGWTRFRRSSWDLFSLAVVSGAFIATLTLLLVPKKSDTAVQLHKFFLVAIVLLVIPRNDALDQLFKTAAASLTVISNLLATWLVFFLVFAIAMTQAFSLTRFGEEEGRDINFRTVPKALILLFRMSLGEGWNQIMEDYAEIEPPLCVEGDDFFSSDCGSKPWARFLFVAWNILSMYIFVNLFVSLIYESFSYVYQRSSGMALVDRDEIRRFKEAWRSVDPAGTGFIAKHDFPRLLGELSGVFQMKIYEAEDSVGQILEDSRTQYRTERHSSIATTNAYGEIDREKLNSRLDRLDVKRIRERRRRFNVFYEEVMVTADSERGIAFTEMLLTLAHYNIINDGKSLRLEEFLKRRARLQRVDEELQRKVVQGFFDTLYWSRKFKQHMERKRAGRMATVPQLSVPDIFVDEEDLVTEATRSSAGPSGPLNVLSTGAASQGRTSEPTTSSSGPMDVTLHDTAYEHPLSYPRAPSSRKPRHGTSSSFSFELYEPEGQTPASSEGQRRGSAVSQTQALGMLDDSVWVDSIRRSTTLRRSDQAPYRYGD